MIPGWCDQGRMWNNIQIGDEDFMICVFKKNGKFEVSLTNLIEIWVETLTEEIILQKCRKLNPLLNIEAFNYNDVVTNILSNISKYVTEASMEEIKLHINIEGGVMKFALNLSKGTPQHFWKIVTKPLCLSSMELIRQHKLLLDLVKKKDEEIAEYKAEGAELIRKNIETETFNESHLKVNTTLPDSNDYMNAFQGMINFYNTLNLDQLEKRDEATLKHLSNCNNDSTEELQQSISGHNKTHNNAKNNGDSVSPKITASKSEEKEKSTSSLNKKLATNKIKPTNMVYKHPKKLKKSATDFIL